MSTAKDVRDAYYNRRQNSWCPDFLMLVSENGFDQDAINIANNKRIYCVQAHSRGFTFLGEMTRTDFENRELTYYY